MSKSSEKPVEAKTMEEQLEEIIDPVGDAISAFIDNAVAPAVEATNCALILGAANTFLSLQIKNEKVTETFVAEDVEQQAAEFVVDRFIGSLCFNIQNGLDYGAKAIAQADKQLKRALAKHATHAGDEDVQRYVTGRVAWLAQQRCQQEFRLALMEVARAAYRKQTGMEYVANNAEPAPVIGDGASQNALSLLTG